MVDGERMIIKRNMKLTRKDFLEDHQSTYATLLDGVAAMQSVRSKCPELIKSETIAQMRKDAKTYKLKWLS